jgi:all-trans-retinol 13,14-reductase
LHIILAGLGEASAIAGLALLLLTAAVAWWRWRNRGRAHSQDAAPAPAPFALADDAPRRRGFTAKRLERCLASHGERPLDAIVIGSGVSGLTCAAMLARSGKKVLVLEQHDVAGGCTHSFEDRGYEFDSGLHYVGGGVGRGPQNGALMLIDAVCEGADGPLSWTQMDDAYDVAVMGGERIPMPSGRERLRAALKARFPDEAAAVDAYFAAVDAQQASGGLFFAGKLVCGWLPARLARWLRARLSRAHTVFSDMTVDEALDEITRCEALRAVLTYNWGDYGLPPDRASWAIHCMVANHYFEGAAFPTGGTGEIARRIIPTIERAGGACLVRAPVASLLVEGGRAVGVVMRRGEQLQIRARAVVSAAGAFNTFVRLLPASARHLAAEPIAALEGPLAAVPPSCAHLMLFVALRGDKEELALPAANYWISPDARHSANRDAFYAAAAAAGGDPAPHLPEFAAVFLSFPSAKDAHWPSRHAGKSTAHIIAECPWDLFSEWEGGNVKHRGAAYLQLKGALAQRLLAHMFEHFPQTRGRVEFAELGTPLSSAFYLGAARGESYGLAHTPQRFRQEWLAPHTAVPGLYLSGQDVLSAGIMGAAVGGLLSAIAVAPRVAADNWRMVARL